MSRNLITDVAGVRVGHAHDARVASGVTAVIFAEPAVASAAVLGGAPGARETALLEAEMTVERVDAIVLSGGSAFGLAAADGAMMALAAQGRGFAVGTATIPIVPQAICFDLTNGGDKAWGDEPPYRRLGAEAVAAAETVFALGTAGGGYGATTANLKGGLGSASVVTGSGHTLGTLVVVNALGSVTVGDGPHFWAAPFEWHGEYGGRGWPAAISGATLTTPLKGVRVENTIIGIVATDAQLTKGQAKRLALSAHDGFARAIRPAHTPLDGDIIFAAATGARPLGEPLRELTELCIAAADTMARAVARGVYEATALPFPGALPAWRERFGAG
ncbi:P1 family peptidase [Chelatococcus reniformis]|uniref:Peptidase T4 n=1 Tax=Chelatococcus reniformis TaxID=1494448 RepID=A0A916UTS0_9HYPH|nr:P1 family peptidase [Chelatococcus reniformis]GGC84609.1 peptidase T4 [Chelatococcus reniformis]